ncbi:hypothetical protein BGZ63DRAFT_495097 [Mariannaea sp. PMI_226]|nr:hypothetical protein BGZ63DRAFT_495097 [Mariannaea sp. PMI_226]
MPESRRVLRRQGDAVACFHDEPIPTLGSSDVLVRVHAVALNYKDISIFDGQFPWPTMPNGIIGTEFAGEIISVGDKIRLFKVGDRVVSLLNLDGITGRETTIQALGQNIDGTLADYVVMPESALVTIPEHLTWAEASVIPCAGLTAWSALNMTSRLCGKTVLIEGTGGVSIIALILAVKAGATVIITSSSDEKLKRAKELGASHVINYKKNPDWEVEVLRVTGGLGADVVIEQGGAATLLKSVAAVKRRGQVSQVGFLSGHGQGDIFNLVKSLISKACSIVGIQVGTKRDLEEFMEFIGLAKLELAPGIDRIFPFEQSLDALDYMRKQNAVGKVVIEMGGSTKQE